MTLALVGLALCVWAIAGGFGAALFDRAPLFVGPMGFVRNMVILAIGVRLIVLGFGFL